MTALRYCELYSATVWAGFCTCITRVSTTVHSAQQRNPHNIPAQMATLLFSPSLSNPDNPPQSVAPSTARAGSLYPGHSCSPHASGCSTDTRRLSRGRRHCGIVSIVIYSSKMFPDILNRLQIHPILRLLSETRCCTSASHHLAKKYRQQGNMRVERRNAHRGSNAFRIVPERHAADLRTLNSKPSDDTSVTYSVSGAVLAISTCNPAERSTRVFDWA